MPTGGVIIAVSISRITQDAEPDRIVAGLEHDRRDDRHRRHHHRQRLHEHAEDDVEDDHQRSAAAVGDSCSPSDAAVDLAREPDRGDDEVEEVGRDQDRHDHRGGAHRAFEGVLQHRRTVRRRCQAAMPSAAITPSAADSVAVAQPA